MLLEEMDIHMPKKTQKTPGKKKKSRHLTSFTKINSKWIMDLKIKHNVRNF